MNINTYLPTRDREGNKIELTPQAMKYFADTTSSNNYSNKRSKPLPVTGTALIRVVHSLENNHLYTQHWRFANNYEGILSFLEAFQMVSNKEGQLGVVDILTPQFKKTVDLSDNRGRVPTYALLWELLNTDAPIYRTITASESLALLMQREDTITEKVLEWLGWYTGYSVASTRY